MINVIAIAKDITDQEIRDLIVKLTPVMREAKRAPGLTISGYDGDLRELCEIPEVQALCRRLVDSGFVSLIDTGLPSVKEPLTIGAFMVWKLALGEVHRRTMWYDRNEATKFFLLLSECNAKCDALAT